MKKTIAILLTAALLLGFSGCSFHPERIKDAINLIIGKDDTDTATASVDPSPAPVPAPDPAPEPDPTAKPDNNQPENPAPQPDPQPEPDPVPAPNPEPDPVPEQVLPYSTGTTVAAGGNIISVQKDGVYLLQNGMKRLLYANTFSTSASICTNGKKIYTIPDSKDVVEIDVESGSSSVLFGLHDQYVVEVVGADEKGLYIGMQHTNGDWDWWGYDVYLLSYTGDTLESLGNGWDAYMREGIMILMGFRSDVSPTELWARNTETGKTMIDLQGEMLVWEVYEYQGELYYVKAPADTFEKAHTITLEKVDGEGNITKLLSFAISKADSTSTAASMYHCTMSLINWSANSCHYYDIFTGEEISYVPKYTRFFDTEGKEYLMDDKGVIYDKQENMLCSTNVDSWNVELISGDYVYVRSMNEEWTIYAVSLTK